MEDPSKKCQCSICRKIAFSVPNTKHRRCSGKANSPIQGRGKNIHRSLKGTWRKEIEDVSDTKVDK